MSGKIGGKQGLGGEVVEGIIIAGWGTCQHLGQREQKISQSQPRMTLVTPDQLETFNMSFTRQLLSGQQNSRRKPVLVSRTRSDPWLPAGKGNNLGKKKSVEKGPFCSVCLNDNLTEADIEIKREMEREV